MVGAFKNSSSLPLMLMFEISIPFMLGYLQYYAYNIYSYTYFLVVTCNIMLAIFIVIHISGFEARYIVECVYIKVNKITQNVEDGKLLCRKYKLKQNSQQHVTVQILLLLREGN